MLRQDNPYIDPDDYLLEAVNAFCLLCDRRSPRDKLLFEVFRKMTLIAIEAANLRLSDRERLRALFNAAVDATARKSTSTAGKPPADAA